jgi:hypothetical protein
MGLCAALHNGDILMLFLFMNIGESSTARGAAGVWRRPYGSAGTPGARGGGAAPTDAGVLLHRLPTALMQPLYSMHTMNRLGK